MLTIVGDLLVDILFLAIRFHHLRTGEALLVFNSPFGTYFPHLIDILHEHCFPELCVLLPKLFPYMNAKSMI
jgi:hypothetical protein